MSDELILQLNGHVNEISGQIGRIAQHQEQITVAFHSHISRCEEMCEDISDIKLRISKVPDVDHSQDHDFIKEMRDAAQAKKDFWRDMVEKIAGAGLAKAVLVVFAAGAGVVWAKISGLFSDISKFWG